MKKFKSLKLMLLGVLAMGSMNAFADGELTNGTLKFILEDGKATITGCAKNQAPVDLVIPNKITNIADGKEYTVGKLQDKAFLADKGKIETIDLKADAVTTITENMFSGLSKLKEIKLGSKVTKIDPKAFVGTIIKDLDLSKTNVKKIDRWFETNCSYTGQYTKATANAKNVATIKKAGGTPVEAGQVKTPASESAGTVFVSYAEVNAYYKAHYAKTADYPAAVVRPEPLPFTKATANTQNKTDFSVTNGYDPACVDAGDPVLWTLEDALAWNVATYTDAMPEGYELDGITVSAYNTATGGTKNIGDVLTAEEAQAYNEKLAAGTHDKLAKVGAAKFEWTDETETATQPVLYTVETAYAYNVSIVAACHKVGEMPTTASTFTSDQEYFEWNNANVVKPQGGKVMWPGVDKNPDTKIAIPAVYYTDDTAYDENVIRAGSAAVEAGQNSPTPIPAIPNTTLESVTLNGVWTEIVPAAFENCQKLATISLGTAAEALDDQPQTIGDKALLGTTLAELSLVGTNVQTLPSDLFVDYDKGYTEDVQENATLTTVTFNKVLLAVPAEIFANCTALATVAFEDRDVKTESAPGKPKTFKIPFRGVGTMAFRNTAIAEITIPEALNAGDPGNYEAIAAQAFYGCVNLKDFTYMVDNETSGVVAVVHDLAFPGCIDVNYNTTNANVAGYKMYDKAAPKNTHFVIVSESGYVTPFETVEYKKVSGKYYIKYKAAKDIRVKKDEAKVYDAYLDDTDFTLNMTLYRASGGYYNITAGSTVLIITNKKDLEFETKSGLTSGSFNGSSNALEIAMDDVDRANLDYMAGLIDPSCVIYGWVNSATVGTGFQKITTGDVFPQGTLYVLAAEPVEGARLNVRWLDENGNIDVEATGIKSINTEDVDSEAIFNLQGIQVKSAQKGIFIQSGKKYAK